MPGEAIVLAGDRSGRIRSFVAALARFPSEPRWAVVGGFAVNVRITDIHRLTNDIDTVSRDQTKLVEILVAESDADRLAPAKLQLEQDGTAVVVDVMADTSDTPLPVDAGERAFALARRMALATSEWIELVVVEDGVVITRVIAPIATTSSLIALKSVAIARRSQGDSPQKVGSDIHDLVRLVQSCDIEAATDSIAAASHDLRAWVAKTLLQHFSADRDLRYTFARLRQLTSSPDAAALTEEDLAIVAVLGQTLLS